MSDRFLLRAVVEGEAKGAVAAFEKVTDGAQKMGKGVETASKQAGRSLEDMEARAKRAEDAGRKLGQGAAALGLAFSLAARDVVANEQAIRTLERGYGDAATGLRAFADEIQQVTTFSNESAISAANTFRVLADNYGFTTEQIRSLIQVSADLAATQGIDLNEAATRVAAAMRGEAESAEYLGLTLNDSALGIDHLAKSTTDAEKSQIRYNALLDQSAFAQGAAAERAETTAGQVEQLANRVQDSTQAFVQWTGPIGEAAGSLGAFGLEAGIAAGGLVQLGRGLATAAPLARGFTAALGPVGLALAAGAALVALSQLGDETDRFAEGAAVAAEGAETLAAAVDGLARAGSGRALLADVLEREFLAIGPVIEQGIADLRAAEAELEELNLARAMVSSPQESEQIAEEMAAIEQRADELRETYGNAADASREFGEAEADLAAILQHQGPGYQEAIAAVERQRQAYADGRITLAEYLNSIQLLADMLPEYDRRAIAAAASTDALGESATGAAAGVEELDAATVRTTKSIGVLFTGTKELSDRLKAYEDGAGRAAIAEQEVARRREETAEATQKLSDRLRDYDERSGQVGDITTPVLPALELETVDATAVVQADAAYRNLADGILTANEAQAIFKDTQDGLIESQGVYQHQQSEYTQQLSALQEAEDILNQRRAEGVTLTAEQADFLDRVNAAQERLTGGAEDAAIAEGMLALQYAENVRIGDQLNSTMEGQQQITGALIQLVTQLIGALDDIPPDVKTNIELVGANAAINQAASLAGTLANIPPSKRIEIVTAFVQSGTPPALAGLGAGIAFQHGGVVPHAQHGIVTRGGATPVVVGEAGPEIAFLPGGTYVSPNPASRAAGMGSGGEVHLHIYGNVYGVDDIHATVNQALRAYNYAAGR